MRPVDQLYAWLQSGPAPHADLALSAALDRAERAWSQRLIETLLHRGSEVGWGALVGRLDALPLNVRERMAADAERFIAGISQALRSPLPSHRLNALQALELAPTPRLSYQLATLVRDAHPRQRALASRLLREIGARLADDAPPADPSERRAHDQMRERFVASLGEALRAYHLHMRVEIIETSLWFARDLGPLLWDALNSSRSRANLVAADHLAEWDHPRLAGFLLVSLEQPTWRPLALRLLQRWQSPDEVAALLRNSDLLEQLEIASALNSVRSPGWFHESEASMRALPEELRSFAPDWVCAAGYSEGERTALLMRWARTRDMAMHRAAVYALAGLSSVHSRYLFVDLERSRSPLATFARWFLAGIDNDLVKQALRNRTRKLRPLAAETAPAQEEFQLFWRLGLELDEQRSESLLECVRPLTGLWAETIQTKLRSQSAADRLLALRWVATAEIAPCFRTEIVALTRDPAEGLARIAQRVIETMPLRRSSLDQLPRPASTDAGDELAGLRGLLKELIEAPGSVGAADLREVEQRLRGCFEVDLPESENAR